MGKIKEIDKIKLTLKSEEILSGEKSPCLGKRYWLKVNSATYKMALAFNKRSCEDG